LSPAGRILGQSPAPAADLISASGSSGASGYFNLKVNGRHYRAIRFEGVRVIDREQNATDHKEEGGIRRAVIVLYAAPRRDIWRSAEEAVQFYVLTSIALLAVTGLALVWFLRYRLSPLQELAAIAGSVSARSWEFVPPDGVLQTIELAPIARSIEELIEGLRESFERQRQLTGDAAHELKTSIAVLKSSLQVLSMNPRTTEVYEAGLEGLLIDIERMEDLASRMLALARLEEAPAERLESSDLGLALRTVADRLQPLAELRQVPLDVTAEDECVIALPVDDAEVLCSNLLMNALQHSSPEGLVSAAVHFVDGKAELRVSDHGEGIPEAALPHVFERFYRADRSRSRNSGGAGLGLSICKAIVERAEGTIQIKSSVGTGTEVTVVLPASRAQ